MRKTVLIVDNSLHVTGALKAIVRSSIDLSDEFDFLFVLPSNSYASKWVDSKGFQVYELSFIELSRSLFSILSYFPYLLWNGHKLKRVIQRENVSLVHCNDLYNLSALSASLSGSTAPFITHIRFLPDKFPRVLFRSWLWLHFKFANRVIAVSTYLMDRLPPNPKLTVIYDKLPEEENPQVPRKRGNSPMLLYLANTIPGKGHEYAVEVFAILSKEFPDWRLRFVGGDMGLQKNRAYKIKLQTRCAEMGIASKTEWSDFTDDIAAEYRAAEIALNFSQSESFSLTTVEALFYGCPIVATACGGPSEIIDHGRTGLLVPVDDIQMMVSSLRELMKNEKLRAQFSEAGAESVRHRFGTENTTSKLRKLYRDALT